MKFGFFLLVFAPFWVLAQNQTLRGSIVDSKDQLPLAFTHVRVNKTTKGTISDSLGRFELSQLRQTDVLIFSRVGFESKWVVVADFVNRYRGVVSLAASTQILDDVVIRPQENPAWGIIRKVLQHRAIHDPDKQLTFRANAYTKISGTVDSLKVRLRKDTTQRQLSAMVFMQETYAELLHQAPDKRKEIIIASVSNMPSLYTHLLNSLPLDLNPLGFYKDLYNFTLLKRFYTSPINPQTFKQYDFEIQDTLYHAADTTFVISFKPYKGVNFEGFMGVLHINSDGYALEKVRAKSADTLQFMSFQIDQRYEKVAGGWFPIYAAIEVWANHKQDKLNGYASLRIATTYSNVALNVPIDPAKFDETNREMRPNAVLTDAHEFKTYRSDSLSQQEALAYEIMKKSKVGQKISKVDSTATPFLLGLVSGIFEWKSVELIPDYLMMVNKYEKLRVGIGFQNNQRLRPKFRVMGAVGYGLRDHQWKYRGLVSWHITPDRYHRLSLYTTRDYLLPATASFLEPNYYKETVRTLPYSFGDSIPFRVDLVKNYGVSLHFKPLPYTWAQIALEHENRTPHYDYRFGEEGRFQNTTLRLDVRFAYKEIFSRIGRLESVINRQFPIINLQIIKALPTLYGQYDYWKLSGVMQHQVRYKRMGYTNLYIEGGYLTQAVPYPYLFGVAGMRGTLTLLNNASAGTFRTLPWGYFLSDKYSLLAVGHHFGRTLIRPRSRYFQPQISIFNKAIYGSLSHTRLHQQLDFKTLEEGYFEAGIEIKDLVRIPIKGFLIGSGLGVAYSYGPNAAPLLRDNLRVYWLGFMPSF